MAAKISKQVTYLVNVTNSLFSYGLPASTSKFAAIRPKVNIDGEMGEKQIEDQTPQFVDFKIVQRICYLCSLTNQIKAQNIEVSTDLESALLAFTLVFKNHVLTDSRMILLGSHFADDANGSDDGPQSVLDSIDGVYNESKNAYAVLA